MMHPSKESEMHTTRGDLLIQDLLVEEGTRIVVLIIFIVEESP